MKTAGELLKDKRLEKELSLEDVARRLKVKEEYLVAVENNDYQSLPSPTAAKGFLRNYARVLYLNPETVLAMFRRDFGQNAQGEIIPKGALSPIARKPRIISANFVFAIIGITVFLSFLTWQYFSWRKLPKLELASPENGETYVGKVTVRGTTTKDAVITINNQRVIVDDRGIFSLDLAFPPGTQSVLIQAESRAGKLKMLERTFQVAQ